MLQGKPAGAAVVATDNKVYRLAVQHGRNGLLVEHTPDGWFNALDKLLSNDSERFGLQYQAYKDAWTRFDITTNSNRWFSAYTSILRAKPNNVRLPVPQGSST
jgi:glycosyltransferase involved in cell wall biosynthesis